MQASSRRRVCAALLAAVLLVALGAITAPRGATHLGHGHGQVISGVLTVQASSGYQSLDALAGEAPEAAPAAAYATPPASPGAANQLTVDTARERGPPEEGAL